MDGNVIRRMREIAGAPGAPMTRYKLAELLGVDSANTKSYEAAKHVTVDRIKLVAQAVNNKKVLAAIENLENTLI